MTGKCFTLTKTRFVYKHCEFALSRLDICKLFIILTRYLAANPSYIVSKTMCKNIYNIHIYFTSFCNFPKYSLKQAFKNLNVAR